MLVYRQDDPSLVGAVAVVFFILRAVVLNHLRASSDQLGVILAHIGAIFGPVLGYFRALKGSKGPYQFLKGLIKPLRAL